MMKPQIRFFYLNYLFFILFTVFACNSIDKDEYPAHYGKKFSVTGRHLKSCTTGKASAAKIGVIHEYYLGGDYVPTIMNETIAPNADGSFAYNYTANVWDNIKLQFGDIRLAIWPDNTTIDLGDFSLENDTCTFKFIVKTTKPYTDRYLSFPLIAGLNMKGPYTNGQVLFTLNKYSKLGNFIYDLRFTDKDRSFSSFTLIESLENGVKKNITYDFKVDACGTKKEQVFEIDLDSF